MRRLNLSGPRPWAETESVREGHPVKVFVLKFIDSQIGETPYRRSLFWKGVRFGMGCILWWIVGGWVIGWVLSKLFVFGGGA